MKRSADEIAPAEVNRLHELLVRLPADAIETVLANLDADELYVITHKLNDLAIVRDLLNAPNAFRRLYDIRKASRPRSKISYLEEDLVEYLLLVNAPPIDYWHVFLCANNALRDNMVSLSDKENIIRIFLTSQLLDIDNSPSVHEFQVRLNHTKLPEELQLLYEDQYVKYAPPARKYQLIFQEILGIIARPQLRYVRLGNQQISPDIYRVAGLSIGDFTQDTFGEALTLHNATFRPEMLLRSEGLYALYAQLENQRNVLQNVAAGIEAKQIVRVFQQYFNAMVSYIVLERDSQTFLQPSTLQGFRGVSGIRACVSCLHQDAKYCDTEERVFCSKECQKQWYIH